MQHIYCSACSKCNNYNFLTLGAHAQEDYCSRPVCECVCLLSHISPLEHLFVLKILPHT